MLQQFVFLSCLGTRRNAAPPRLCSTKVWPVYLNIFGGLITRLCWGCRKGYVMRCGSQWNAAVAAHCTWLQEWSYGGCLLQWQEEGSDLTKGGTPPHHRIPSHTYVDWHMVGFYFIIYFLNFILLKKMFFSVDFYLFTQTINMVFPF